MNSTVKEIVYGYLVKNGYDGLYNDDTGCSCLKDDLFPCECFHARNCKPGYYEDGDILIGAGTPPKNTEASNDFIRIVIDSSSRHPKCKGWKKYDWGMMDGPEYGCGYNTTIECNECMYCVGEKDPERP